MAEHMMPRSTKGVAEYPSAFSGFWLCSLAWTCRMLSSLAAETSIGDFLSGLLILVTALLRLRRRRIQAALGGIVVGVLQAQEVGHQRLGAGRRDHFDAFAGAEA